MLKVRMVEGFSAFVDPWDVRAVIPAMAASKPVLGQSIMYFATIPKMILIGIPEDLDAAVDSARREAITGAPPIINMPGGRHDGN